MSLNVMQSAHGSSSRLEGPQGEGAAQWTGGAALNINGPRFLPSASESLLRTSAADNHSSRTTTTTTAAAASASAAGVAAATDSLKATAAPICCLPLSGSPDLIERSAFLYGLLHSDRLVYDVHDAIATLTAVVADKEGDDDDNDPDERRRAHGRLSRGSVLSGVFYFPSKAPWRDMPWRPTYKSAVLLCVFVSAASCQRAITRLSEVATLVRGGAVSAGVRVPSFASPAPSRVSSPRIVLRAASEYTLSHESVDTALLTFLTAPQVADLLLRRRRMQVPLDRGVTDSAGGRGGSDRIEDMLTHVRAHPPPSRLSSSAARLYAAILSPQSTYSVNWAAAQVAVNRGDGIVVPETEVVEPWVGGGRGLEDRGDVLREPQDRRGGSETAGPGRSGGSDGGRCADPRSPWDTRTGSSGDSLPMTLQEMDYQKRYGLTPQGRLGGGGGSDRRDSSEGLAGLMPSRSSLYLGARQVVRGASWIFRRLCDGNAVGEAPLLTGPSGSSGSAAGLAALPIPTSSRSAPHTTSAPLAGAATLHSERGREEPPRQRYRTEDGSADSACERRRSAAVVIPRYNAVGTALSWMPGFEHFGRLFVTSTTVLTPEGAAPPVDGTQRSQRRRQREAAPDDYENPAWESLVMRRYTDATAERTLTSQGSRTVAPVHDSVLSWMSPARGTGWPASSSWPSEAMLQTQGVVTAPLGGQVAASAWKSTRTAEPSFPRATAQPSFSGLDSLAASTIATDVSSAREAQGSVLKLPSGASTIRSSFDGADDDKSALGHASSARRRSLIKVEGVLSASAPLDNNHDGTSFLSHHRRRHGWTTSQGEGLSTERTPDVHAADATRRTAPARPSLAEGLRQCTREAREGESTASPPHTPLEASQRTRGVAGASAGRPSASAMDLSARSSRRVVSFTLPNEAS